MNALWPAEESACLMTLGTWGQRILFLSACRDPTPGNSHWIHRKKMALDDLFPGISDWPLLGSAESALPRVAVMSYYRAFKSCPVALLRGHCRGWTRWRWVTNLGGVLV